MKTILDRLKEMPHAMLVRVAKKFKLTIDLDEEREDIIRRLEDVITEYFMEQKQEDVCIDGSLAKYNLLADFEVPHEILDTNSDFALYTQKEHLWQNPITYINSILIDNQWCYVYWALSYHDYDRLRKSKKFQGLELHIVYNNQSFNKNYKDYQEKQIVQVSLQDTEMNLYQQHHNTYCHCLLISREESSSQLLAVSEEIFLPHVLPVWDRDNFDSNDYNIYELSLGKKIVIPYVIELDNDKHEEGDFLEVGAVSNINE